MPERAAAIESAPPSAAAFELSAEQREVLDAADRYAREELYPLARGMDDEESWPAEAFARLGQQGYLGITIPAAYGGSGLDLVSTGLVAQAFSRWNHALGLSWIAHDNLCCNNLYRHGTEAQRRRYLPGLCSGELLGALALTEPGAGSDALGSMRMSARRDGDDYVLNGTKIFITNGPVADVLVTYAKTAPELGTHGISAFIVEKNFPGFSVAQKLTKMGFRGSQTGELVFENCRVPVDNRLGAENGGLGVVMTGLDLERATIAPICLGRRSHRRRARRSRRIARAQRRISDVRRRDDGQGRGRCAADPRRQRLHLGVGGQPAVSCDQDARDRRRHDRSAQADHQPRAAGNITRWLKVARRDAGRPPVH
jgi:isovaleryl-CoA dehydrogenase